MANHLVNKKYIDYIKTLNCVHCRTPHGLEPHHVIGTGDGKMGGKAADIHAVPMCALCHSNFHLDPTGWPQLTWVQKTQEQAVRDGVLRII